MTGLLVEGSTVDKKSNSLPLNSSDAIEVIIIGYRAGRIFTKTLGSSLNLSRL